MFLSQHIIDGYEKSLRIYAKGYRDTRLNQMFQDIKNNFWDNHNVGESRKNKRFYFKKRYNGVDNTGDEVNWKSQFVKYGNN